MDLYGKEAPKTVNNFLGFCIAGYDTNLSYWNCKFHKIVKDYIIQGGDILYEDGTGAWCVYEKDTFEMEENNLKFKEPYLLAASKRTDGSIGSQFFVTTDSLPFLTKEYCIFGRISQGRNVIDMINNVGSNDGIPTKEVRLNLHCFNIYRLTLSNSTS
jgi:cyclophilin family peptidyl-prolyl cis-trans isomerase